MQEVDIGYCPQEMDWAVGDITIATKPGIETITVKVESDPGVDEDWIYAPEQRVVDILSDSVRKMPYRSRIFGLPRTHTLRHDATTAAGHIEFLTWCLGFLMGMRLTQDEAGFLDATPIKPGALHDIVWLGESVPHALEYAERYWRNHADKPSISKGLTAVIHSYFLSQTPILLEFERFIYLYIAIDGAYRVCKSMDPQGFGCRKHCERIKALCSYFQMNPLSEPVCDMVSHRNEAVHEGIFFGEALGFRLYGSSANFPSQQNVLLEITGFVSRLIVAILGLPLDGYIRSSANTRQLHGVRV